MGKTISAWVCGQEKTLKCVFLQLKGNRKDFRRELGNYKGIKYGNIVASLMKYEMKL